MKKAYLFFFLAYLILSCQTVQRQRSFQDYLSLGRIKEPYDSNRESFTKKAVFILTAIEGDYPEGEGAFELELYKDTILAFEKLGFDLSIRYAKSLKELRAFLRSFPERSVDVLSIGGHGESHSIDFGEDVLEPSSFSKDDFKVLKDSGFLLLDSCDTGRRPRRDGVCIAQQLSCGIGYDVVAPQGSVSDLDVSFKKSKMIFHFRMLGYTVPVIRYSCKTLRYVDGLTKEQRRQALKDYALKAGVDYGDIVQVRRALKRGAQIDKQDVFKRTSLFDAVEKGELDIVKVLIDGGADLTLVDINGKTALDIAREKGFQEIEKLLLTPEE